MAIREKERSVNKKRSQIHFCSDMHIGFNFFFFSKLFSFICFDSLRIDICCEQLVERTQCIIDVVGLSY